MVEHRHGLVQARGGGRLALVRLRRPQDVPPRRGSSDLKAATWPSCLSMRNGGTPARAGTSARWRTACAGSSSTTARCTAPARKFRSQGRDVAFMPEHEEWWNTGTGWYKREVEDGLRWFVFDDRKMYRPGEEVQISRPRRGLHA